MPTTALATTSNPPVITPAASPPTLTVNAPAPARAPDPAPAESTPNRDARIAAGTDAASASSTGGAIGGRAPASRSFLAVLGAGDLSQIRDELRSVQGKIATAQQGLDAITRQLDQNLADAQRARAELSRLQRELSNTKTRRAVTGGAATVFGFLLGGPIGAVIGNAAGFATIAAVDRIEREMRSQQQRINQADYQIAGLQTRKSALLEERRALDARAVDLNTRATAVAASVEDPAGRMKQLAAARREALDVLRDAKELLGDYTKLTARAIALGVAAEKLRADLEGEVARVQQYLGAVDREVQMAVFNLAFSMIGASEGLELLGEAEARALRTALTTARFFEAEPAQRTELLTSALLGAVLPADAGRAARMAGSIAGMLAADIGGDRDKAKALIAGAALDEAQRALAQQLLDLPESVAVLPMVRALISLGAGERAAAARIFKSLASAPSS